MVADMRSWTRSAGRERFVRGLPRVQEQRAARFGASDARAGCRARRNWPIFGPRRGFSFLKEVSADPSNAVCAAS